MQDLVKNNNENGVLKSGNSGSTSSTKSVDGKKKQELANEDFKRKDETMVFNSGAVDSWEELDSDDYNSKLISEVHIIA